jgi:hypothetical protein
VVQVLCHYVAPVARYWKFFIECRCSVGWFDAGDLLYEPLYRMRKVVQAMGFYSPFAKGTVAEWTHPATPANLKADPSIYTKQNQAGYCVAANYRFPKTRAFVQRWKDCALEKECIAPGGSNRYNHRLDMSLLSILAYRMRLPLYMSKFRLGYDCQPDAD